MNDFNGILLVNKPKGFTSFDVIAKLRGILKMKRIGHSGTLDPMATGVLPVFLGKATKACDMLPNDEKSYTAGFKLGIETDTQDTTGKILREVEGDISRADIEKALSEFCGEVSQIPPMYSAVSVNGQRLYDLARKGIEVERKPRMIRIDEIKLLDFDEKEKLGTLFIACSKGTYIRTIIHDLGLALGSAGVMTSLVRNSSSGYRLDDCLELNEIQELSDMGEIKKRILPVDSCFKDFGEIHLSEKQEKMYRNGVKLDLGYLKVEEGEYFRVYGMEEFLGIGFSDLESGELKIVKNFF